MKSDTSKSTCNKMFLVMAVCLSLIITACAQQAPDDLANWHKIETDRIEIWLPNSYQTDLFSDKEIKAVATIVFEKFEKEPNKAQLLEIRNYFDNVKLRKS